MANTCDQSIRGHQSARPAPLILSCSPTPPVPSDPSFLRATGQAGWYLPPARFCPPV